MVQSVITRVVRVAAGPFAPGHLGELTQQVPFEMVDAVLAQTRCMQRRVRDLPSRVVVYLLLAGCLFAELGYRQVWQRLVAGLDGLPVAYPSEAALTKARQRVGPQPLRALFDLLRGPAAAMAGPVRWRGLLVCAIDGTMLFAADSAANLTRFSKQRGGRTGGSGYPMLRLVTVMACGTRSVMDAVFGAITCGETTYARDLLARLPAGVLLLADRNFAAGHLLKIVTGRQAHLLVRAKTGRGGPKLSMLHRFRDGSYRSVFGGQPVRVIDAEISIATKAGTVTGVYRLITTLLDPQAHPATAMLRLYHERWEIETAYLEIKSSILGGRVLRARTPAGVDQEIHALLVTYQILRTAMTDATNSDTAVDPDRASFTIALHAARDQIVHAAGVIADTVIDLVGNIGRLVLNDLLPERRLRVNARTVKRAISKYNARGPNIDRRTYQATISLTILAEPP
ncbi:IS4 family transposase [Dactylosporangium roseum]|uniref:IS4 family transposase n=1 Tax=Dactylosporangium roseum TaxID=47989 RepID=A0ABY5Z6E0_9ACTN|nr:IS4 family transposase [Dactylosporangium roseum]UWZ36551.1 IS4 family transposase [Dactylosporangium roseum]UWZ36628.1 IS4 family transposase [Dactylosporangium roseum]